jgi:L-rhamnose mutarotase
MPLRRFGQIIRLRPERYDEYKRLHDNAWPEVLALIHACNIRNYSVFHRGGLMFAYFEYTGDDIQADMAKAIADPKMREWWVLTDPCQQPFEGNSTGSIEGNWWLEMEELFHLD